MNETIGAKGGRNDRRRVMTIKRNELKRLKQYHQQRKRQRVKELEKKVRKLQVITFFQTIPLLLPISIYHSIVRNTGINSKKKSISIKQKKALSTESLAMLDEYQSSHVNFECSDSKKKEKGLCTFSASILDQITIKTPSFIHVRKKSPTLVNKSKDINQSKAFKKDYDQEKYKDLTYHDLEKSFTKVIPFIPPIETLRPLVKNNSIPDEMNFNSQFYLPKLRKIEDRCIVEKYENDLKQVRMEYKEIISSSYNLEDKQIALEASLILDRINEVIEKLDQLKEKIKVDKEGYEDYYYEMIEKYTKEFDHSRAIDHIKDSELYILISKKIKIMDNKKQELLFDLSNSEKNNDDQKEENDYFPFDQYKQKVDQLQQDHEKIMKKLEDDVKVLKKQANIDQGKIKTLNLESLSLLSLLLSPVLRRPSIRNAKVAAVATLTSVYFMNQILTNQYTSPRKKQLKEEEYRREIESSIHDIDDVMDLIHITNRKVDELISNIKDHFKDYLDDIQVKDLLGQLNQIKKDIKEREEEIAIIKSKQQKSYQKRKDGNYYA